MNETIIVSTGEVKTGNKNDTLKSSPIGSCVVVILFEEKAKTGGMAHIMLPGKAPSKEGVIATRYALNAIEMLIQQLDSAGVNKKNLNAIVVGGGNVLKRKGDTIGIDNLNSVTKELNDNQIEIEAFSIKGTERKSVRYNLAQGTIYVATGDEIEKLLYRFPNKPQLIV